MRSSLRNTFTRATHVHGADRVRPFRTLVHLNASPEQKLYMLAKAAHEAAAEAVQRDVAAITVAQPTKEEIHAGVDDGTYCAEHPWYVERGRIEEKHQLFARWRELLDAENDLVRWARENAEKALGERFALVHGAFDAWPLFGGMRKTLLDICFRMEVKR